MSQWAQELVLTSVPLFVAIDAVGTLPIVLGLRQDMTRQERKRVVHIAIATASALGIIFLLLGKVVLQLLDIKVGHFRVLTLAAFIAAWSKSSPMTTVVFMVFTTQGLPFEYS